MLSYRKRIFHFLRYIYKKEYKDELLREFHISGMLAMELVFIINQGFQLHASVINWKDKGILFLHHRELENLRKPICGKR